MANKPVIGYWARWNLKSHQGMIWVKTDDNIVTVDSLTDPREFGVVVDLLRNEKPLFWDSTTRELTTSLEPPGEGEPA